MKTKVIALLLSLVAAGCGRETRKTQVPGPVSAARVQPLSIVLVEQPGTNKLDNEIRNFQAQVRAGKNPETALERLGWLFVAKARASFDPGYYKLAEQCSLCLGAKRPNAPEALLLRGHVLQNLHRFKEAEPLARRLAAERGRAFDYGLLGDVLMEQGRLEEAVEAYQKMADLKPDLHACARAAHIRWLKGDLEGAIEMMQMAVHSASPLDAESAAWVYSRMALYQLQSGDLDKVREFWAGALEFQSDYAPALLLQGKTLMAEGRMMEAVAPLSRAAALNPLPEYQWTLSEAWRASGRIEDAVAAERPIFERGAAADPRTLALFLATRGADTARALRLAQAELETRNDVFTFDALAWALGSAGRWDEAAAQSQRALAEGTRDARLFLHAGIIAAETGNAAEASRLLNAVAAMSQMLLPSEKALLAKYAPHALSVPQAVKQQTSNNTQNQKGRS